MELKAEEGERKTGKNVTNLPSPITCFSYPCRAMSWPVRFSHEKCSQKKEKESGK